MKSEPSLLRRLVGLGWQILLLWAAVFIPVGYLIWRFNPPTYEAVSILRVEPASLNSSTRARRTSAK